MDTSGPSGNARVKGNQNIQVYLRVRPMSVREHSQRSVEVVDVVSNRDLHVRQAHDAKNTKKFSFDRVFGTNSKQKEIYSYVVAPLINEVLSGYNCTVFAYGQTGTGKTHTMVGDESPAVRSSWEDDNPLGIIPRAVVHLFDELRMNDVEFSMRISYLELYNEELCDLLATEDNRIRIFDDTAKKGSVIVHGLEEIPVHCKDDVYKLLAKGQERRKTAQTLMNAQSSRSHTVFSIVVYTKENGLDGEEMLKTGKLNLVDLAGSENITKAGNEKGIRTREAVNINQSLLTLGRVITALVERQPHVPYRESKLTRLLQESLGGRTKTSIIATISPGHKDLEETLNTLDYAHRAKNILNRPEINQRLTKKTVLKEYTEEIDKLKRDLLAAREKNGIYLAEDVFNDMTYKLDCQTKELTEKTLAIRAMKDEMEKKDGLFDETRKHLDQKLRELKVTSENLNRTNLVLRDTKEALKVTEQRYEESSHLVQVHEKTERELTGQAKSLLEVADGASSDTQGLHEALKRRKIVDGEIHKTVETFVEEFNGEIDVLQRRTGTFRQGVIEQASGIDQELEMSCNRNRSAWDAIRCILGEMESHQSASSQVAVEYFSKYRECLAKSTTVNSGVVINMLNELELRQKNCHVEIAVHVNQLKSIEEKNRENFTGLVESVQTYERSSRDNMEKYTEVNKEFLKELEQHHNVILGERNDEMRRKMEQMIEMNNSILTLIANNDKDKKIIKAKSSQFLTHVDDYRENLINHLDTLATDREDRVEQSKVITKEHGEMVEKFKERKDGNIELLLEETAQLKEVLKSQRDCTQVEADALQDKLVEHRQGSLETFQTTTRAAVAIVERAEGNVEMSQSAINSITNETRDSTDEFNSFIRSVVHKMQNNLENLERRDLQTYTSTGETPVRREFKYPKNLVATSPHERILNRFRATANRFSSGMSESEQENSMELACMPHPLASTPNPDRADDRTLRELNSNESNKVLSAIPRKEQLVNSSIIEISSDEVELQ